MKKPHRSSKRPSGSRANTSTLEGWLEKNLLPRPPQPSPRTTRPRLDAPNG